MQCQYRLALAMHNYRIGTARRDSSRLAQTERLSQGISPTRGQDAVNGVSGFSGVDSLACGAGRLLAQGRQGARSSVGKVPAPGGKHRALARNWADQVHLESDDRRGVGWYWQPLVRQRVAQIVDHEEGNAGDVVACVVRQGQLDFVPGGNFDFFSDSKLVGLRYTGINLGPGEGMD